MTDKFTPPKGVLSQEFQIPVNIWWYPETQKRFGNQLGELAWAAFLELAAIGAPEFNVMYHLFEFEGSQIILRSSIDPEIRTIRIDADVGLPYAEKIGEITLPEEIEPERKPN